MEVWRKYSVRLRCWQSGWPFLAAKADSEAGERRLAVLLDETTRYLTRGNPRYYGLKRGRLRFD